MKKIVLGLLLSMTLFSCSNGENKTQNKINARPTVPIINGEVQICTQVWNTKNLNVSRYRDGTPIPQVTDLGQWANLTTGAWCYYNNSTTNGAIYGKLYNWYAVAGIYNIASLSNPALRKKLAPTGWHVPSDDEWSALINCLDPNAGGGNIFPNVAGGKMKATGVIFWMSPNTSATNESGFTGLGGGYRNTGGSFHDIGNTSTWWSSTENDAENASTRVLARFNGNVFNYSELKSYGFWVRCIKD